MSAVNKPAFPHYHGGEKFPGLTMRDWFAGQASEADIQQVVVSRTPPEHLTSDYINRRAWARYQFADAMLLAREGKATP